MSFSLLPDYRVKPPYRFESAGGILCSCTPIFPCLRSCVRCCCGGRMFPFGMCTYVSIHPLKYMHENARPHKYFERVLRPSLPEFANVHLLKPPPPNSLHSASLQVLTYIHISMWTYVHDGLRRIRNFPIIKIALCVSSLHGHRRLDGNEEK